MYDGVPKGGDFNVGYRISISKPTLILGAGIGGVGKSTFFRPLARALVDSVYVDKDTINYSFMWKPKDGERSDMTRYLPYERIPLVYSDRNGFYYRDNIWLQSYHFMLMMARQMLALGKHPILDGNYVKEIRWGYIEKVLLPQLQDVGYELKIVLMHAPADIIRKRLISRAAEHDKLKISSDEEWQKLIVEQPPIPPEIERYPHIKVDTSEPLSHSTFKRVLDFLAE